MSYAMQICKSSSLLYANFELTFIDYEAIISADPPCPPHCSYPPLIFVQKLSHFRSVGKEQHSNQSHESCRYSLKVRSYEFHLKRQILCDNDILRL